MGRWTLQRWKGSYSPVLGNTWRQKTEGIRCQFSTWQKVKGRQPSGIQVGFTCCKLESLWKGKWQNVMEIVWVSQVKGCRQDPPELQEPAGFYWAGSIHNSQINAGNDFNYRHLLSAFNRALAVKKRVCCALLDTVQKAWEYINNAFV